MTTPYTPKVGDILTGVDARGVRGPVELEAPDYDGSFFFKANFEHVAGDLHGDRTWPKGTVWRAERDGRCPHLAFRVLFEPWQEPAAESAPASATDDLVDRFAAALKEKLRAAEAKYGYNDGWLRDDWQDDLAADLLVHVRKGDPRDVAAYCAFAWHHGWSVARNTDNWSQPAPKLTTIGEIAGKVKPGTVVAVHLVVEDGLALDTPYPLRLNEVDGDYIRPRRATPCTIISEPEPEPEPWSPEPGKPALFLGHDVTIVAIDQASDEAWVRGGGVNGAVPLAELERPQ